MSYFCVWVYSFSRAFYFRRVSHVMMNTSIYRIFRVSANKKPKRDGMECLKGRSDLWVTNAYALFVVGYKMLLFVHKNLKQMRPCEGENCLTFALWFWSGNHSRHKVHADNNVVCALRNVFRQLPFGWLPVWRSFFQRRTLRIEEAVDAKSLCLLIALWECDTHFHWYCLCEGDITSIHFVL